MQIREQHMIGAQQRHLGRLRLLDLDDQLRLGEHALGIRHDPRALLDIRRIRDRRPLPRPRLHDDLMAVAHQLARPGRGEGDPVLVGLDLRRHSDEHARPPFVQDNRGDPPGTTQGRQQVL